MSFKANIIDKHKIIGKTYTTSLSCGGMYTSNKECTTIEILRKKKL